MTPALVESAPLSSLNPAFRQVSGVGQYKEAYIGGPRAFKKDVELEGSKTQPAAKYANYLPVWDPKKRKSNIADSMSKF